MIMKRLLYITMLISTVLTMSCTGYNTLNREPQPTDTIYTGEAAMSVYGYNPERALVILDSAEIVGNLNADEASFLRAKVFSLTFGEERLDTAQMICNSLLQSKYVKNDDKHEEVLDLLISIYRKKENNEMLLKYATEKAELCRKKGDDVEALRTEVEIGVILTNLGNIDEGLATLDEVIEKLDVPGSVNRLDASILAMRRKINVLRNNGRYAEVIPISHHIAAKLDYYEKHHDQYANDSYRLLPDSADRARYIDFCRSTVYNYLADAYANESDLDSARYYLALFEQSDYGKTFGGRRSIAPTWIILGDYDKALAVSDEMVARMGTDTINTEYSNILWGRAIAADARGDSRAASGYWRRYAELNDILSQQLQQSEAHEYAARYRAQEQQMEIEKFTIQNRMQNIIILVLFTALLVIVLFYNYTVFQRQRLREKNAALVNLIDKKSKKEPLQDDERLAEACKMLSEHPDMKIAEIANKVGLTPRSLHKLFREQYGISPSEYRTLHK